MAEVYLCLFIHPPSPAVPQEGPVGAIQTLLLLPLLLLAGIWPRCACQRLALLCFSNLFILFLFSLECQLL